MEVHCPGSISPSYNYHSSSGSLHRQSKSSTEVNKLSPEELLACQLNSGNFDEIVMKKELTMEKMKSGKSHGEYLCPACNKVIPNQHEFTVHIRMHKYSVADKGSTQSHICGICCKVLSSASSLDRHMLVHSGERPFKCKYCKMAFTTNGNMHRHMRTHKNHPSRKAQSHTKDNSKISQRKKLESENDVIVIETKVDFKKVDDDHSISSSELSNHFILSSASQSKLNCNLLLNSIKAAKKQNENAGLQTDEWKKENYNCADLGWIEFSSQKFPMYSDLYLTTKEKTDESNSFGISDYLKCRLKDINNENSTEKDIFFSQLNLRRSITEEESQAKDHNDERKVDLKMLVTNRHGDFADIPSILSMSSQPQVSKVISPTSINRNDPMAYPKHGDIPKPSEEIENISHEADQLSNREGVLPIESKKLKTYECEQCDIKFKSIHSFRRHNRLQHQNRSVFSCHVCNYTSGDKSTLIRHLRTHNGERPFQCSICKYAFTTKANCERHIKKRHNRIDKHDIHQNMEQNIHPNSQEDVIGKSFKVISSSPDPVLGDETTCHICKIDMKFNRILRHHMKSVHSQVQENSNSSREFPLNFALPNEKRSIIYKDRSNAPIDYKCEVVHGNGEDSVKYFDQHRPKLTDDELSSIEAIVNLANSNPSAAQHDEPLDLAIRALDLRVRTINVSSQAEVKTEHSELKNNSLEHSNTIQEQEVHQIYNPAEVLDLSREQSPDFDDDTCSNSNQELFSDSSDMDTSITETDSIAESQTNDLASISELLQASKKTLSVNFDNEDEAMEKAQLRKKSTKGDDSNEKHPPITKKRLSSYSNSPNSVSCPFCRRKFPWASSLRRHILTHTGQKPYKCSKCPLLFTTKSNCERHLFRKHDVKEQCIAINDSIDSQKSNISSPFRCSICSDVVFSRESCLLKHYLAKHSKEADLNCSEQTKLKEDSDEENDEIPVQSKIYCPKCLVAFDSEKELENHLEAFHGELPFKCYVCDKNFTKRAAYFGHMIVAHSVRNHNICLDCKNENNVPSIHIQEIFYEKHSSTLETKSACIMCLRKFLSAEDYKVHMRTVPAGKPSYTSSISTRKLCLKQSMLYHRRKHEDDSNIKN